MNTSRRNFLKIAGLAAATLPLAGMLKSNNTFAADELPAVKESDAMAKSLGFCSDANKPSAACADRKAKDKKDQFCNNCQLYTKLKGEGKAESGKCMLFTKNTVPGQAWCKSWVKKPG